MINTLIAGAGRMGRCLAYDASKWSDTVFICDSDLLALKQAEETKGINTIQTTGIINIEKALKSNNISILISCLPYKYNFKLTQMCIDNKVSMIDLGGNIDVLKKQFSLSVKAKRNKITIIPDCGLAPGMSNILVGELFRAGYQSSVKIRVGGLPATTRLPLKYGLVFSIDGLINEYTTDVISLKNSRITRMKPIKDIEDFDLQYSFDRSGISRKVRYPLEIASTSGGTSTLPYTFKNQIKTLNYKTIRYKGHYDQIRSNLNAYSSSMLKQYLSGKLKQTTKDIVLLAIEGRNKYRTKGFTMYHRYNSRHTAMMETTAYSASVVASMVTNGIVRRFGVIDQETNVDSKKFIKELEKLGISINRYER